jgi:probable phosphoglycerate mutase
MDGVGLSQEGRRQAEAAARALRRRAPSALYVSPLQRAGETADAIAEALGLQPVPEPALNEIDFGRWTGLGFDELGGQPGWAEWNRARDQHRPPGGESMLEAQARIVAWMDSVRRTHDGETLAAVSHCDLIKAAAAHALGLPLDHYDRFDVAPGSLSVVLAGDWGLKLQSLNEEPA